MMFPESVPEYTYDDGPYLTFIEAGDGKPDRWEFRLYSVIHIYDRPDLDETAFRRAVDTELEATVVDLKRYVAGLPDILVEELKEQGRLS